MPQSQHVINKHQMKVNHLANQTLTLQKKILSHWFSDNAPEQVRFDHAHNVLLFVVQNCEIACQRFLLLEVARDSGSSKFCIPV